MRRYLIITGYQTIDDCNVPLFSPIELLTNGDAAALYMADLYYERFELCEMMDHLPPMIRSFIGFEEDPILSYNLN